MRGFSKKWYKIPVKIPSVDNFGLRFNKDGWENRRIKSIVGLMPWFSSLDRAWIAWESSF